MCQRTEKSRNIGSFASMDIAAFSLEEFCAPSKWGPLEVPKPAMIGGSVDGGDFTACFEELIIVGAIPTGILLILTLGSLRRFCSKLPDSEKTGELQPLLQTRRVVPDVVDAALLRYRIVFGIKIVLLTLIVGVTIFQLLYPILTDGPMFDIVSTSMLALGWGLCIVLTILEYRRGLPTSPALITFFICSVFSGTIKLRTILRKNQNKQLDDDVFFAQYALYFCILAVGMFAPSRSGLYDEEGTFIDPESRASWISKLTYWWVSPLLRRGRERTLFPYDTCAILESDKSAAVGSLFEQAQQVPDGSRPRSLISSLYFLMGYTFWTQAVCVILATCFLFVGPLSMFQIVRYIDGEPTAPEILVVFIGSLLAGPLLVSILDQLFMHQGVRIGIKIRAAVIGAIVKKASRLPVSTTQDLGIRAISSLISIDAERLRDLPLYLHRIWAAPLQIIIALLLLLYYLGLSALAGFGVMLAVIPLNYWVSRINADIQTRLMNNTDERLSFFEEMIHNIQTIKLLSLEDFFKKRLDGQRKAEVINLRSFIYFQTASFLLWQGAPVIVSIVTFGFYSLIQQETLKAGRIFTSLALFNILKMPLYLLPMIITKVREGHESFNNIEAFLQDNYEIAKTQRVADRTAFVRIKEGGFKWDDRDPDLTLRGITVDFKPHQLSVIAGAPESGKTSLLMAILGELVPVYGTLVVSGKIAFVASKAWLQNSTIRENILFGLAYDVDRYEKTVLCCSLVKDFLLLENGDGEQVGESGLALTASQQQRVNLARAVYSMLMGASDILIMDDPLTAVDISVSRKIVHECINGALRNRTRIIATSQLALFLPEAHHVVVLSDGAVVEQGPQNVLARQGGLLTDMLRNVKLYTPERSTNMDPITADSEDDNEVSAMIAQRVHSTTPSTVTKDDSLTKHARTKSAFDVDGPGNKGAPLSMWWLYLHMSGGLFYIAAVLVVFSLSQSGLAVQDFWMSWWVDDKYLTLDTINYFQFFGLLGIYNLLFILLRSSIVAYGSLKATRRLHDLVLTSVMRAPFSFFEATPFSTLINRLGRDQQAVDQILSPEFSDLFTFIFMTLGMIVVITYINPFFLVAMLPIGIVLNFVARYYISAARQLKRLDAESRSKIHDHFSEMLNGLATIRASEAINSYLEESGRLVDANHRAFWSLMVSNRWLGLRLEFVGSMVVFFAGIFMSLYKYNINGGLAGIGLLYALSITNTLNWLVRTISEVDAGLAHFSRCISYTQLPSEPAAIITHNRPPEKWPSRGKVTVHNLVVRLAPHLPPLLKGVTFETKRMEKVGIVVFPPSSTATASATAIIHSFFRLIEPEDGFIKIDNVDIGLLGLSDLRSALAIIPKDPLLFTGTLRDNIDPERQYEDADIWRELRRVHLEDIVSDLPSKLMTFVIPEEDSIFTLGQLQLLALARALLKDSKVVVIDELTTFVDSTTDAMLQKTIRTEFLDCTVLTVASRLKTIIDYDRVLVIEKGLVVEFDSPANLLCNETSLFHNMCLESGEYDQLRQLAGQREYVLEELSASVPSGASADGSSSSYFRGQQFFQGRPAAHSGAGGSMMAAARGDRYGGQNRARSFIDSNFA